MSDPMMNPMPGPKPPMGQDPVQANKSLFNPADASLMKQSGEVSQDMSVRDFMQTMGIDVDGPVSQLFDAAGPMSKQMQNKGGVAKMQNIAQGAGPSAPPGPPMLGQSEKPSMDSLLGAV